MPLDCSASKGDERSSISHLGERQFEKSGSQRSKKLKDNRRSLCYLLKAKTSKKEKTDLSHSSNSESSSLIRSGRLASSPSMIISRFRLHDRGLSGSLGRLVEGEGLSGALGWLGDGVENREILLLEFLISLTSRCKTPIWWLNWLMLGTTLLQWEQQLGGWLLGGLLARCRSDAMLSIWLARARAIASPKHTLRSEAIARSLSPGLSWMMSRGSSESHSVGRGESEFRKQLFASLRPGFVRIK